MNHPSQSALAFFLGVVFCLLAATPLRANDYFVSSVEGAPPPFDERLVRLVAEELNKIGIPATREETAKEDALFELKGVAEAVGNASGTVTTIRWDVLNLGGVVLATISVEDTAPYVTNGDPWAALDMSSLKRLASKTADKIESGRDGFEFAAAASSSTASSAAAARSGESVGRIAIGPIKGAPGDGNEALALALAQVMRQYSVTVEANPGSGIYYTKATVSVADKNADTQTVRIAWDLSGPGGTSYGVVEQENDVPRGSLQSQWGDVAVYAAAAAGDGIVALMQQLGTTPPNVND